MMAKVLTFPFQRAMSLVKPVQAVFVGSQRAKLFCTCKGPALVKLPPA